MNIVEAVREMRAGVDCARPVSWQGTAQAVHIDEEFLVLWLPLGYPWTPYTPALSDLEAEWEVSCFLDIIEESRKFVEEV